MSRPARLLSALAQGAPYVLLLALSAVVVVLALSAREASAEARDALAEVRPAVLTAAADSAETAAMRVPALALPAAAVDAGDVAFVFYFGIDDCSDKVVPEVDLLNEIHRSRPGAVRAYWAPTDLVTLEQVVRDYQIEFPVVEGHPAPLDPALGTPFVLVVEPASGALLDAYRAIPQDVHRQETFFARWDRIAGLGLDITPDPFVAGRFAAR